MKTRSTSRSAASSRDDAPLRSGPSATVEDARAATRVQLHHQQMAASSSQVGQLKERADMMAGGGAASALQRVPDEELLQGKFEPVQRMEEEELLQGKFEPVQRMEEEELLQGKFAPVQRMEEEELLQGKFTALPTVQRAERTNSTGMPDQLKSGIESLSGMRMDHVKVHYNSDKPAQLNAHAYAQGSDIHMAPGQEQHLPHEAWHVVQQMQGRVKPTMQMKGDVPVNDDAGLENEADVMGAKAMTAGATAQLLKDGMESGQTEVRQNYAIRVVANGARHHYTDGWGERYGITDDQTLIARVPKAVRGSGWIDLGWHEAPEAEQIYEDRFEKQCWIGYANADEAETTLITHCGPSGPWRYI